MPDSVNQDIYRRYAPIYDLAFGLLLARARRKAVRLLELRPDERVFIPGVGTGLDLPLIRNDVEVVAGDISPEMLAKAQRRAAGRPVELCQLDAQAVNLPDASFDAVLLNLVLSVVPDGQAAFREAWRVLRPGGRLVIFDKFLPEESELTRGRRLVGWMARKLGTDPNRCLKDILEGTPGLQVMWDEPSLLGGQYRILLLTKGSSFLKR